MEYAKHTIVMSEVMPTDKVNFSGNIFGGYIMQLMDRVAYACSAQFSSKLVVTLSADQILFKAPIHVGELVTCYASVNYVGKSSMEIGIKAISTNLFTQEEIHVISSYFTMIAVDENFKPTPINKTLELKTAIQKQRHKEALLRKEIRMKPKSQI